MSTSAIVEKSFKRRENGRGIRDCGRPRRRPRVFLSTYQVDLEAYTKKENRVYRYLCLIKVGHSGEAAFLSSGFAPVAVPPVGPPTA